MNPFALSFAVMLTCILAEIGLLRLAGKTTAPWSDVVFNLNSGHILMWVLRGVEIVLFGLTLSYFSLHWVERWPVALQWLFAFVAWDFCFYWMHRMHHKVRLLWAVHVVHHQGEHFNLSLGVRNSWYSSLTDFPFVAILAVLGVPLDVFVAVSSFHYGVQFYNHNALVGRSGGLDKIMITPAHHRVHHGIAPIYRNKNFGGTLLLWDKLFGTFQAARDDVPLHYGVPGSDATCNPLWANHPSLRQRIARWLPMRPAACRRSVPERFVGVAGILLFALVIYYVARQDAMQGAPPYALFATIFAGTLAIGAMSDGARWGVLGWVVLALAAPVLFVGVFHWRAVWPLVLFTLLGLHGLDGVRVLLAMRAPAMAGRMRGER